MKFTLKSFVLLIVGCLTFANASAVELNDTAEINRKIEFVAQHYYESDYHPDSLYREIVRSSEKLGYNFGLYKGYRFMALYYAELGQYEEAVSNLMKALPLIEPNNSSEVISVYGQLADVYRILRNYDLAYAYLNKTKNLIDEDTDTMKLGMYHLDLANYFHSMADSANSFADSAKKHVQIALDIYSKLKEVKSVAACNNSLGVIEQTNGNYALAIPYYHRSIEQYTAVGHLKTVGVPCQNMAASYWNLNNYDSAIFYYRKTLQIGNKYNSAKILYAATKDLAVLFSELGQYDSAYHYQTLNNSLGGELFNTAKLRTIREMTEKYNFEMASNEYKTQRRNYLVAGLFMILVLLMLGMRFAIVWRSRRRISAEKQRSENLLLNILPSKVAEELKETGKTIPQYYPECTIFFADIENFTITSESLTATELIKMLDDYFQLFDRHMMLYGLEKIKTIGDAYMAASGVPEFKSTHALDAVNAAVELQHQIGILNIERSKLNLPVVNFRIGIHSGSVVAGVVGQQKFQYDIWGDAVNMAARMEETSSSGKVNISAATYHMIINEDFIFEPRGKINAKNKGEIEMYFVNSKEYLEKINIEPLGYGNYTQFNKDFIERLKAGLSSELTYHGFHHIMDVLQAAKEIGASENLSDKEWQLLNTAILLHDSGFMFAYDNHEERSCALAEELLPQYGYSAEDIEVIKGMIRATKIPQKPQNILEQIIADADLEYLGTDRFDDVSETLFIEWNNKNIMHDRDLWNQTQIKFISAHSYFTNFCKQEREGIKRKNLAKIRDLVNL